MSSTPRIRVKRVRPNGLALPAKGRPGDAGFDLRADLTDFSLLKNSMGVETYDGYGVQRCVLLRQQTVLQLPVGFAFEIPPGYEGQVRGRSGLAFNDYVTAFHIGTIDANYRGEMKVMLYNNGWQPLRIYQGDRIAQLIIAPIAPFEEVEEVAKLSETNRGASGFGSSGKE